MTAAAPAGSPLPAPLRHLSAEGVPCPRNRERPVPTSRFAAGFSDEILDETTSRIAAWWSEAQKPTLALPAVGLRPRCRGSGSSRADEVVYRIAVAAALAFRLDRDRAGVVAAFGALDKAGVLADLYQGTVPENLPAQVDARALMLASLAARRCAEVPELAVAARRPRLRRRGVRRRSTPRSAAACSAPSCSGSWTCSRKLGVIRYDDLGDFTVTPHRIVRDTLFRLGFIDTPYASDGAALAAAARAARKRRPRAAPPTRS